MPCKDAGRKGTDVLSVSSVGDAELEMPMGDGGENEALVKVVSLPLSPPSVLTWFLLPRAGNTP